MTKHLNLTLSDEEYVNLNYFKSMLQKENKKKLTWEDFLVRWVSRLFATWFKTQMLEPALAEAMKELKPEVREEFRRIVIDCVEGKLREHRLGLRQP